MIDVREMSSNSLKSTSIRSPGLYVFNNSMFCIREHRSYLNNCVVLNMQCDVRYDTYNSRRLLHPKCCRGSSGHVRPPILNAKECSGWLLFANCVCPGFLIFIGYTNRSEMLASVLDSTYDNDHLTVLQFLSQR